MPVSQGFLSGQEWFPPCLVRVVLTREGGMRSHVGLPKMHVAGDTLVSWSGVFLYWRMARWYVSTLMSPWDPTLLVTTLLMVFTAISALHLL